MGVLEKLIKPGQAARPETVALLRRVLREQGTKHWRAYALAYALMAIAAGCTAASAYVVGHAVNTVYSSAGLQATAAVCILIVLLFLTKGLASYGQAVTVATINMTIGSEYRLKLFAKMLHESLGYVAGRHSTEINNTINFASGSAGSVLSALIFASGRDLLTLAGLVGVMVVQAPLLSLACFLVMPIAAIGLRKIRDEVGRLTEQQFAQGNATYETAQETFQGFPVVKAFGLEGSMMQRFRAGVEATQSISMRIVRLSGRSSPLLETLGGVAVALLFMYGAYRNTEGALPGEIFSFVAAFLLAYDPMKKLARLPVDLASTLVGVRMLYEALDAPSTEPDDSSLPALDVGGGEIAFENVVFSYRPGEPVLRTLSLVAGGQAVTALVGPSGSGKSTIFRLLLRLYQPESGAIRINGTDIATVSRASVRRQIAYVGQDTFLFRGTIRENILVGRPDATDDEVRAAAVGAFAHDFISAFPRGYDTPVGEHGIQLSTGQRQRVAIARALIKDAPIILLDESTASLDSESEREVRAAIARICKDRTTLVIAHRLHTVLDAGRICVVEDGAVTESGTYSELMRRQGRFATLSKLQFEDQAA